MQILGEIRNQTNHLIVQPKLSGAFFQTIFSLQNSDGSKGFALVLVDGTLSLKTLRQPQTIIDLQLDLRPKEWTKLDAVFSMEGVSVRTSVIRSREKSETAMVANDVLTVFRDVDH